MVIYFSSKRNDIYPWDDVHEGCSNPPENVWRISSTLLWAVICIRISDLGL